MSWYDEDINPGAEASVRRKEAKRRTVGDLSILLLDAPGKTKQAKLLPREVRILRLRANWLVADEYRHCNVCGIRLLKPKLEQYDQNQWAKHCRCVKHRDVQIKADHVKHCALCGKRFSFQELLHLYKNEEQALRAIRGSTICGKCKELAEEQREERSAKVAAMLLRWTKAILAG
ncbi:MAG TPA: hypothetical protein VEA59_00720 [Patescibacteria group bacterium]|nr:hypothetical protein [Patescibacteria group bacterium]